MINHITSALITLGFIGFMLFAFMQSIANDNHMHKPGAETSSRGDFTAH